MDSSAASASTSADVAVATGTVITMPKKGVIMTQDDVLAIIRHLLTTAGGALVANGLLTATQAQDAVGAVVVLTGIAWSLYNKFEHRRALAAAVQNRN